MKKTITQWSMVIALLVGSLLNAQQPNLKDDKGRIGVNVTPRATLDIQTSAENLTETATTNEGIIPPKISKTRLAQIADDRLVEGTIVYIDDVTYTATPANAKVKEVTEKGYYLYNGERWTNVSSGLEKVKYSNDKIGWRLRGKGKSEQLLAPDGMGSIDFSQGADYPGAYGSGGPEGYGQRGDYAVLFGGRTNALGPYSAAFGGATTKENKSEWDNESNYSGYKHYGLDTNHRLLTVGSLATDWQSYGDEVYPEDRLSVLNFGEVGINIDNFEKVGATKSGGRHVGHIKDVPLQVGGLIQSREINEATGSATDKLVVADNQGVLKTIDRSSENKHRLVKIRDIAQYEKRRTITGTAGRWDRDEKYGTWRYTGLVRPFGCIIGIKSYREALAFISSKTFYLKMNGTERISYGSVDGIPVYKSHPTKIQTVKELTEPNSVKGIMVDRFGNDGAKIQIEIRHDFCEEWILTSMVQNFRGGEVPENNSAWKYTGLVKPVDQLWYYDE